MKIRYKIHLTDENLKYCLYLCLNNYEPSSVSYHEICRVMHQLCCRKVNEKRLLVNCFILKRFGFNKWSSITFMRLTLLHCFTFLCLVNLIFIQYVLWQIANGCPSFRADHRVQTSGYLSIDEFHHVHPVYCLVNRRSPALHDVQFCLLFIHFIRNIRHRTGHSNELSFIHN